MRRFTLFAVLLVALAACGDKQNKAAEAPAQVKSAAAVDPLQQQLDGLKKMPQLGLDELSTYLPASLEGMKRSNLTMESSMGYGKAHADYIKNSKTDIRVNIYDCAGEAGSSLFNTEYASRKKAPKQTEDSYVKTVPFDGNTAVESWDKSSGATTLTYPAGDQVLVMVTSRNVPADKVQDALRQIVATRKK
jgi:hypothetical protein